MRIMPPRKVMLDPTERQCRRARRAEVEEAIERLIGLLDEIDGDADLEANGDEFDESHDGREPEDDIVGDCPLPCLQEGTLLGTEAIPLAIFGDEVCSDWR